MRFNSHHSYAKLSTLSFRQFSKDMCIIADEIKTHIDNEIANEEKYVKFEKFNMCSLVCYECERSIKPHRDNVYRPDGTWNDADNCQVQHTPVATLVYGDTRELHFQLYRHRDVKRFPGDAFVKGTGPIEVGDPITFVLRHGDVVYLDSKTESYVGDATTSPMPKHSSSTIAMAWKVIRAFLALVWFFVLVEYSEKYMRILEC